MKSFVLFSPLRLIIDVHVRVHVCTLRAFKKNKSACKSFSQTFCTCERDKGRIEAATIFTHIYIKLIFGTALSRRGMSYSV